MTTIVNYKGTKHEGKQLNCAKIWKKIIPILLNYREIYSSNEFLDSKSPGT